MNKEYVYNNGQVLIIDENNNQKVEPYYDDLKKVLVQENVIEELEKRKKGIEELLIKLGKDKKNSKKRVLVNTILFTLFGVVLPGIILTKFFDSISAVQFGQISQKLFVVILSTAAFVSSLGALSYNYLSYRDDLKRKQGKEIELELLNKKLAKEKETLEELKKNKTNSRNDNDFFSASVDDLEHLDSINDWLYLYFCLGINKEKYLKYYKRGILKEKLLAKGYDEEQVAFADNYFEEKGPRLVKKR